MATLILPDGTEKEIVPNDGVSFKLEELQGLVEGYIEYIFLPDGRIMVINEEGKIRRLPYNFKASMYGNEAGIAHEDFVVGPAVICSNEEAG